MTDTIGMTSVRDDYAFLAKLEHAREMYSDVRAGKAEPQTTIPEIYRILSELRVNSAALDPLGRWSADYIDAELNRTKQAG